VDDDEALAWAIDELVRLIEIGSISDHEHEVMEYVAVRCRALGFPTSTHSIAGAGPNVLVRWGDHGAPLDLLLTAHLDTIAPIWDWDGRARVDGTVVTGLGAQDDKGCAVAILLAALLAREAGVPMDRLPIALGFVVDEEVGGKGSKAMATELRPRYVVASEGSELDTAVVETGYLDGSVGVLGRSVHGSLIEEGDNAVVKAALLIPELLEAPFTTVEHPIAGRNMASVQRIESSAAMNAIPDHASFLLTSRIFGQPSLEEVRGQIDAICMRHDATFDVIDEGGWWETPTDGVLVEAMRRASERAIDRTPGFTRMPSWTDAHSFVDRCNSEVVVFGPGHLRAAHRPDEHIDAKEIVRCARVFAALLADASSLSGSGAATAKEGTA
jgi:acetylornithine deacetylase/succinyl-diaminopimelate desuccinylase-like protein